MVSTFVRAFLAALVSAVCIPSRVFMFIVRCSYLVFSRARTEDCTEPGFVELVWLCILREFGRFTGRKICDF